MRRPIWRFAQCEFDELEGQLWAGNERRDLFPKTRMVLVALLKAKQHRLTRKELCDTVWPESDEMDQALSNAIRNLRTAISPNDRDSVIRTIHGTGFQIVVPVERRFVEESVQEGIRFVAGESVPGKREWRLKERLDLQTPFQVWLAERPTTNHIHVFHFANDGSQLESLRREIDMYQRLEQSDVDLSCFVKTYDWRDTTKPFYIETEFGGSNLLQWTEDRRLDGLRPEVCLQIIADLADAVAVAHAQNIIHNDIRPQNIFISSPAGTGSRWQVKLSNFRNAVLTGNVAGGESDLPNSAKAQDNAYPNIYVAPEVQAGGVPSTASDVYALGVLLFQILCGDFRRVPALDWESFIDDPVLRQDIIDATNSDPARRLQSPTRLAERLRSFEDRKQQQAQFAADLRMETERANAAERRLTENRARRPWVLAAILLLLIGAIINLFLYRRALGERDIAEAINGFLSEDLLTRASPYKTGKNQELLVDAIEQASPQIDLRFSNEPLIAAHLHQTIARALDYRMEYISGDREYVLAADLYRRAEGPLSQDAVITQLQRAGMQARNTALDSLSTAKTIYAQQTPLVQKLKSKGGELPVWDAYAHGLIQIFSADAPGAIATFSEGLSKAEGLPTIDQGVILTMQHSLFLAEMRSGDGAAAEALVRRMIETVKRTHYKGKPNLTNLGVNLAQAFMVEQKNAETIVQVNAVYPAIVQQMGEASPLSQAALGARSQAESNLGQWDDAARDLLTVRKINEGKDLFIEVGSLSDAGLAQCRGGHYVEGTANARKAVIEGEELAKEKPAFHSSYAFSLASCLVGLKDTREAARILSTVDGAALAQVDADPDIFVDIALTRVEIELQDKAYDAAADHLAQARSACTRSGVAPFRTTWFHRLQNQLNSVNVTPQLAFR